MLAVSGNENDTVITSMIDHIERNYLKRAKIEFNKRPIELEFQLTRNNERINWKNGVSITNIQ